MTRLLWLAHRGIEALKEVVQQGVHQLAVELVLGDALGQGSVVPAEQEQGTTPTQR